MVDDAYLLAAIAGFYEAFNSGDYERAISYYSEDVDVMNGDQHTASNRADFLAAALAGTSAGWTGQKLISLAVRDNVASMLYENTFADGSTTIGAGAILFNEEGKICQVRSVAADRTGILRAPR